MKRNLLSFLLVPVLLFFISCKKDGGGNNGGSSSPYYFTAIVNGAAVKYEADDLSSVYGCGISQPESSIGFTDYDIYEGTVLVNPADFSKNVIRVHILKYFNHDPSAAERSAMIKLGTYGYGVSDVSSSTVNGASIDYIDASGNNWFSETGPQTGSTFTMTELVNNSNGTSGKLFKATFSCKLYNANGTSSISVSNATIRGKILSP
ncbi:MAG TPA: hypothetical protein VKB95_07960 [Chitinophagaceae bacterium]|nr:hypothetical protein [Chitinophagaceae bacterium]